MIYSLDKNLLKKLTNEFDDNTFYGASQSWYPTFIQRLSGCGPTAAANLYFAINDSLSANSKKQWLSVMQDFWGYVTPGLKGLNKVEDFTNGSNNFFLKNNLPYICNQLKFSALIPPSMVEIVQFISSALSKNHPVAFLNLNNGKIKELDSWHWVTIVQLELVSSKAFVTVFDGDKTFEMNLSLWCEMTRNRGGFAHFSHFFKA